MLCSKLHGQKSFRLKHIHYKIGSAPPYGTKGGVSIYGFREGGKFFMTKKNGFCTTKKRSDDAPPPSAAVSLCLFRHCLRRYEPFEAFEGTRSLSTFITQS